MENRKTNNKSGITKNENKMENKNLQMSLE